jgi:hypothetical protein
MSQSKILMRNAKEKRDENIVINLNILVFYTLVNFEALNHENVNSVSNKNVSYRITIWCHSTEI